VLMMLIMLLLLASNYCTTTTSNLYVLGTVHQVLQINDLWSKQYD